MSYYSFNIVIFYYRTSIVIPLLWPVFSSARPGRLAPRGRFAPLTPPYSRVVVEQVNAERTGGKDRAIDGGKFSPDGIPAGPGRGRLLRRVFPEPRLLPLDDRPIVDGPERNGHDRCH